MSPVGISAKRGALPVFALQLLLLLAPNAAGITSLPARVEDPTAPDPAIASAEALDLALTGEVSNLPPDVQACASPAAADGVVPCIETHQAGTAERIDQTSPGIPALPVGDGPIQEAEDTLERFEGSIEERIGEAQKEVAKVVQKAPAMFNDGTGGTGVTGGDGALDTFFGATSSLLWSPPASPAAGSSAVCVCQASARIGAAIATPNRFEPAAERPHEATSPALEDDPALVTQDVGSSVPPRFENPTLALAVFLPILALGVGGVGAASLVRANHIRRIVRALAKPGFSYTLFTRIAGEDILRNPRRNNLASFVRTNPGARQTRARKILGISAGSIRHHVRMLEMAQVIRVQRVRGTTRLFPCGLANPNSPFLGEHGDAVVRAIKESPGLSQLEIAGRLGMSQRAISYHMTLLKAQAIVRVVREGKFRRCYPAGASPAR